MGSDLTRNFRLVCKGSPGTNTTAYLSGATMTKRKHLNNIDTWSLLYYKILRIHNVRIVVAPKG
jgi:hypothetical protein